MGNTIVERDDERAITPFWNRIPRFFLFPLEPRPLLFMLGIVGALLVASVIPLLRLPVAFLATFAFLRYCYDVLDRTAFGQSPAARPGDGGFGAYRPWKQLLVFVLYGVLVALARRAFGEVEGYAVEYGLLLLLPANVMWLGLTNSLFASLNPVRLIEVVQAIGWPYLGLCVFLQSLSAAADTAGHFLYLPLRDTPLGIPAYAAAQMYFTLIAFNMLGYALYQYHDRLGLRVAAPAPPRTALARNVRQIGNKISDLDARLKRLLDAGRTREATDLIYELVRLNPQNRAYHERYRSVLRSVGDRLALVRHGAQYIELLLKEGEPARALELYRECQREDASFHLHEAAAQLALAEAAMQAGDAQLAATLIEDFDATYPLASERAAAYLLGARLLHERFGEAGEAQRVIEELLRRFPASAAARDAGAYLARLRAAGDAK